VTSLVAHMAPRTHFVFTLSQSLGIVLQSWNLHNRQGFGTLFLTILPLWCYCRCRQTPSQDLHVRVLAIKVLIRFCFVFLAFDYILTTHSREYFKKAEEY